jgi:hypothetical protein
MCQYIGQNKVAKVDVKQDRNKTKLSKTTGRVERAPFGANPGMGGRGGAPGRGQGGRGGNNMHLYMSLGLFLYSLYTQCFLLL